MTGLASALQIAVSIAILATTLYNLWRMIQITAEARAARIDAIGAAKRSEAAAKLAASHAKEAAEVIKGVGADIKELTLNTNSIKDALVASTAKASDLEGEKRGIEIGRQETAKKE